MNAQHTPTPYEAIEIDQDGEYREWLIRNDKGRAVARIDMVNAEGAANAAYIVRACNAHDDLVAALRKFLDKPMGRSSDDSRVVVRKSDVEMLRAALAKAGEGA